MSRTIGLVDVLVVRADAITTQKSVSAGVDLVSGLVLLAAGALVVTGRVPRLRKTRGKREPSGPSGPPGPPGPPGDGRAAKRSAKRSANRSAKRSANRSAKGGWAQRLLAEPRLTLAALVGTVIGIPGVSYLTALHNLVAGKYPTATQVIAVFVFVIIDFLLIIIPFAFLLLRPEATKARLSRAQAWLLSHARQLMAAVALLLGAYLTVSGIVRLT